MGVRIIGDDQPVVEDAQIEVVVVIRTLGSHVTVEAEIGATGNPEPARLSEGGRIAEELVTEPLDEVYGDGVGARLPTHRLRGQHGPTWWFRDRRRRRSNGNSATAAIAHCTQQ